MHQPFFYQVYNQQNTTNKQEVNSKQGQPKIPDPKNTFLSKEIDITTNIISYHDKANRYVQISIICLSHNKEIIELLDNNEAVLKDLYIKEFNALSYNEIRNNTIDDIKDLIKNAIKEKLNVEISDIYITKFVYN